MKIIVTQKAKDNLIDIFEYNLNISIKYAIKIDKKISTYIEELKDAPYIGRYVPEISDSNFRELICDKYRIIYFISENRKIIFIMYIFNSKQDKSTFLKLHKKEIFIFLNRYFN